MLLDSAFTQHKNAYNLSLAINDKIQIYYALQGMGNVMQKRKDYAGAINYYTQAEAFIDSIGETKELGDVSFRLYECYKEQKKYNEALIWFTKYKTAQDSANSTTNKIVAIKFELDYGLDKKETLDKLEKEKIELLAKKDADKRSILIYVLSVGNVET